MEARISQESHYPVATAVVHAEQEYDSPEFQFLRLLNAERSRRAIPPLAPSIALSAFALRWSATMANMRQLTHVNFASRVERAFPNRYAAENIAQGYPTAEAVFAGWMASPDHRHNMLSALYRECGLAVVGKDMYWCLDLIG